MVLCCSKEVIDISSDSSATMSICSSDSSESSDFDSYDNGCHEPVVSSDFSDSSESTDFSASSESHQYNVLDLVDDQKIKAPIDYEVDPVTGLGVSFRNGRMNGRWETKVTPSIIYQGGVMHFPNRIGRDIPELLYTIPVIVKRVGAVYDMELRYAKRNFNEKHIAGEEWRAFLDEHNVAVGDVLEWEIEQNPIRCKVAICRFNAKKGGKNNGGSSSNGGKKGGSSSTKVCKRDGSSSKKVGKKGGSSNNGVKMNGSSSSNGVKNGGRSTTNVGNKGGSSSNVDKKGKAVLF